MLRRLVIALAALVTFAPLATAQEHAHAPEPFDFSFEGPFGTYDRAAVQRGFLVYKQVCAACHSMSLVSFRTLEDLGYSEEQVKAL